MARNRRGARTKGPGAGPAPEQRRDAPPSRNRIKVVSGGQTGVDRGALDAALELKLQCGGWCPEGRLAEDGPIPEQYPMQEVEGGDYRDRTRKNVLDSDGTAIIYFGEIEGGTESTLDDCVQLAKPYQLINGAETQPGQAAKLIADFVRDRGLQTLNVAGPRASKVEKGHKYAFDTVCMAIDQLGRKSTPAKRPGARGGRQQQRPNGQGQQAGGANGNERTGQGRNGRFSNQRRKNSGQQNRAKQGVKSP